MEKIAMKQTNWQKRFDSNHPLINVFALVSSFNRTSLGAENKNVLVVSKDMNISFYRLINENVQLRGSWLKKFFNQEKMSKNIRFIKKAISQMDKFSDRIRETDFTSVNKQTLYRYHKKYIDYFRDIFIAYNMSQPEVSEPVENYLQGRLLRLVGNKDKAQEYFLKLTLPSDINLLSREKLDWLKIVRRGLLIKNKNFKIANILNNADITRLIVDHSGKYGWVSTQENLSYMDENYYKDLIGEQLQRQSLKEVIGLINKIKKAPIKIDNQRKKLIKIIADSEIIKTTKFLCALGFLRLELRLAWTKGAYYARPIFTNIEDKAGLDVGDSKFFLPREIYKLLVKNSKIPVKIIDDRRKGYIMWLKNGSLRIYTGRKMRGIINQEVLKQKPARKTDIIFGITANPGYARGRAKIIHSHQKFQTEEVKKMKKGQILIAGSTKPQLIEACRKAIAIVTDEGGLLSHAAIVSRELGIPCVVGTKIGTKIFEDNDKIEVDAGKGIIKKLM